MLKRMSVLFCVAAFALTTAGLAYGQGDAAADAATTAAVNKMTTAVRPWEVANAPRSVLNAATNRKSCRRPKRNSGKLSLPGADTGGLPSPTLSGFCSVSTL